ncbi:MAG: DNA-binding protein YbiB [Tepidimonas ignava]|uniref:Anthranilate phosphoribosyltransferase n=1 Tax=Tepidimonas ignava TaxID=114249 RepID=A0A4R3LJX8_9BURK|nr:DNA-binding protein YbiB [Tepidimonas ignava]TCS99845.1 anthranilate phosphoribosyltransferase [Tepidimonas ignava]TSE23230.1 Anthranilate phosphoribosyltransferase [Tepidimonas ignava]
MSIAAYLKEIGRGHKGARALSREQAHDLLSRVLDGRVSDVELGAFAIAMRIKGETRDEMLGFLDAVQTRLARLPDLGVTTVVLPSHNGARRLPLATPLLALLLARAGVPVVVHGSQNVDGRVSSAQVFEALGITPARAMQAPGPGQCVYIPTHVLCPALQRLLDLRRALGVRNPAHSLVKLINPCAGRALLVVSYTHPDYATVYADTLMAAGAHAMLLRGSEGEPVADPRRVPQIDIIEHGTRRVVQVGEEGPVVAVPPLPLKLTPEANADYIRAILDGQRPLPRPLSLQVEHILQQWHARAPAAATHPQPRYGS